MEMGVVRIGDFLHPRVVIYVDQGDRRLLLKAIIFFQFILGHLHQIGIHVVDILLLRQYVAIEIGVDILKKILHIAGLGNAEQHILAERRKTRPVDFLEFGMDVVHGALTWIDTT